LLLRGGDALHRGWVVRAGAVSVAMVVFLSKHLIANEFAPAGRWYIFRVLPWLLMLLARDKQ
jgi:hypothetical protein